MRILTVIFISNFEGAELAALFHQPGFLWSLKAAPGKSESQETSPLCASCRMSPEPASCYVPWATGSVRPRKRGKIALLARPIRSPRPRTPPRPQSSRDMESYLSFRGRRALVTGAGKGIGRAVAVALSRAGAHVTALSRTAADLESLTREIVARQMIAQRVAGAIVNVSSQASKRALRDHAVYCSTKSALDMLSKVMAMELGPHKIRVNTVNPTVVMTDMGRINWSDPQKSAAMINRIPLGKFAEVDDVVNSILFLLSDKSAMTTGSSLMIDGGFLVS
ncbi:L-xylulose reductase isoform 2-T2 [Cyanocitta cristata]